MRFPNMGGEQNIEGRFLGLRSEAIIRSMEVLFCCVWLNWWHLSWNLYKRATEFVDWVRRSQNYRQGEAKRRRSSNLYRDGLHCGLWTFQLFLISLCNDRNLGNKVLFKKRFPFGWVSWVWQRCPLKAWLMQYLINSSLLQLGSESNVRRLFTIVKYQMIFLFASGVLISISVLFKTFRNLNLSCWRQVLSLFFGLSPEIKILCIWHWYFDHDPYS